jgi:hypothetical protein
MVIKKPSEMAKEEAKNPTKSLKPTKNDPPPQVNTSESIRNTFSNPTTTNPQTHTLTHPHTNQTTSPAETRKSPKTRITVKYDVGFNNTLYLRGKGVNLSWEKGTPLKNIKADEWVWETEAPFTTAEFKVLINDKQYESGNNHSLICGANIHYTPTF